MKRVTRNGVIAVAALSGAMAASMPAFADSSADGAAADSPGVISGNTIQLPVHVPVNVCGNTVNVVGLLNPAAGNSCVNEGGAGSSAPAGAAARGDGKDSPGVISGNGVQLPVHLPVNVTGNSVNVVGVGNPATGNTSTNTSGGRPPKTPVHPAPKPPAPPKAHPGPKTPRPGPRQPVASLAHTGSDLTVPAAAGSAALLLGGAALYRRFRPGSQR
ncbi:MAG: chaplin [Streptomyces sp.]|nr:chaplin [Streptomyces sp.]NUR40611.1 chaplin [Streptomyces sp.]NUR66334.1 chaplin [Streptomyces sp.]NUS24624.1 chaplin [Streptomyces sp.]NUS77546.1 chaplin [Streptomyces sp.]